MTKRILPQIEIVDDDIAITRTPFDPDWVEKLKGVVPANARDYDPASKEWTIYGRHHIDSVIALTKRHFPQVKVVDSRRASSTERRLATLDHDFAQLHLLPTAKPKIVRLVYRELAKESHPDRGGTHEAMLALNASYERLQQAGAA